MNDLFVPQTCFTAARAFCRHHQICKQQRLFIVVYVPIICICKWHQVSFQLSSLSSLHVFWGWSLNSCLTVSIFISSWCFVLEILAQPSSPSSINSNFTNKHRIWRRTVHRKKSFKWWQIYETWVKLDGKYYSTACGTGFLRLCCGGQGSQHNPPTVHTILLQK